MGSVVREGEKSLVCMFAEVQGEALLFVIYPFATFTLAICIRCS